MKLTLICLCAVLLDRLGAEPRRWHPVAGFRWLARQVERLGYGPTNRTGAGRWLSGTLALLLLIIPPAWLAWELARIPYLGVIAELGLLTLALGITDIEQRARAVVQALQANDLDQARLRLSRWVSRETRTMDEGEISLAVVERVLKDSCPALFGVVFWFIAAGASGVVVYRLVTVLDGLWGYVTPRYWQFGWSTARLNAALNWLPARLTALSYALLGDRETAWRCWRRQAGTWRGMNNGALLAAGAGALNLQVGGIVRYYGRAVPRPVLGEGLLPYRQDIGRALQLVGRSAGLWIGLIFLGEWLSS